MNSTADDDDAHPYDRPETPDFDETTDGICEDAAGRCTLRAALEEAAIIEKAANITFSVGGTMTLGSSGSLSVPDGSTIVSTTSFKIQGSVNDITMGLGNGATVRGLTFSGGLAGISVGGEGNIVGSVGGSIGNTFYGMTQIAILVGGNHNIVRGNIIGFDPLGGGGSNPPFGIMLDGSYNTIGGTISTGNTISGCTVAGILISGDAETGYGIENTISGNYIGTDVTGEVAVPNVYGIEIISGDRNTIGGLAEAERNIISGNSVAGVMTGILATNTLIRGNYIGTNVEGSAPLGNKNGIIIGPGSTRTIAVDNIVNYNDEIGIQITGMTDQASIYHRISGNQIIANGQIGIVISGNATYNVVGSSLADDFEPNQITSNEFVGVGVVPDAIQGIPRANTIRKNNFFDNGIIGIAVTAPAQDGILAPTIMNTVSADDPNYIVVWGTHQLPGSVIDVYAAEQSAGSSVSYEGRRWLDQGVVGSNHEYVITVGTCDCHHVVVTATDQDGNTSEFSEGAVIYRRVPRRFNSGANMVSVGVGTPSSQPSAVFPGSSSGAFTWSGGPSSSPGALRKATAGSYVAADTLKKGVGYFIRYDGEATDSLTGFVVARETIAVTPGWNLIGSVSDPIPVSRIASSPAGMQTSQFFRLSSSYEVADTIMPGGAYWVSVNEAGSLVLALYDSISPSSLITVVPDTAMPPPPPDEVLGSSIIAGHVSFISGWNMISVPVKALNFQKDSLFPAAASSAYSYTSNSYTAETVLRNGAGYWVKYGSPATQAIAGHALNLDTIQVASGWNLVGSISSPIPASQVVSIPGGMTVSQFYAYNVSYQSADTIEPGKAYWVKASGPGALVLGASGVLASSSNRVRISPVAELPPPPPFASGLGSDRSTPVAFRLSQNYPNPFNPSTRMTISVPAEAHVSLDILDILGHTVAVLVEEDKLPGDYSIEWNAADLPAGLYFCRLRSGPFMEVRKLLLMK